jgi:hypothetical protein
MFDVESFAMVVARAGAQANFVTKAAAKHSNGQRKRATLQFFPRAGTGTFYP